MVHAIFRQQNNHFVFERYSIVGVRGYRHRDSPRVVPSTGSTSSEGMLSTAIVLVHVSLPYVNNTLRR